MKLWGFHNTAQWATKIIKVQFQMCITKSTHNVPVYFARDRDSLVDVTKASAINNGCLFRVVSSENS